MQTPTQSRSKRKTRTIYLIGDDGCDKSFLFHFLELDQEELHHEINVYVKLLPTSLPDDYTAIEIYDFPTDHMIRSAMGLYLKLLPAANCLLYFMKEGASEKDICEWIRVLHDSQVTAKLVFLSDVATYLEREKILTRLAREFEAVLNLTFFVKLEPFAFRNSFEGLDSMGACIEKANCLRPTLTRKIINFLEKMAKVLRRRGRRTLQGQP